MTSGEQPALSRRFDAESELVIVSLSGELDTYGSRQIGPAFAAALGERTLHAVVDLSDVSFITSAGLAMFVMHAQALHRGGGSLHLAAPRPLVAETLRRAGFTTVFRVFDSLEAALTALSVSPIEPPSAPDPSPAQPPSPDASNPDSDETHTMV